MSIDQNLAEKLKRIEALFAGATTQGEKVAAGNAIERIKKRIEEFQVSDPPVDYKFSLNNRWSRRLFVALLRRYDITPFRRYRQRYTTVMANVSKKFVDETLWPEFIELDKALTEHLDKITKQIISESIFEDSSEAEEVKEIA